MAKSFTVVENQVGMRLDAALVDCSPLNKTQAGNLIKSAQIHINGVITKKAGTIVSLGDLIDYPAPAKIAPPTPRPVLDLEIMYEDAGLLIINKPAGLLVHPASRPDVSSVVDFSRLHSSDIDPTRPGIVHRLDRDTSGLLIIAKHEQSKTFLQQAFKNHDIKKHYTALVHGHMSKPEGIIDLPIDRATSRPTMRQVSLGGRSAKTVYRTLAVYNHFSLLSLEPFTGRTHQLRVHLAHIGHPIVGDSVYGSPGRDNLALNRQFLHAGELNFLGPDGKRIEISSALPLELENVLAGL